MRKLVIAMLIVSAGCGGSEVAATSTTVQPAAPPTTTVVEETTTTTAVEETTTTTAAQTTTSTAVRTPSTEVWDAWTLILASLETDEPGNWERAEEIAAGIDGAAVIWSDDYPSLNPGYWVVHWGEFPSASQAGDWCPDLPDDLTCYPRYLGDDVSPLAAAGHVLVIDGQALVVVDVATGERLKTFDPYFDGDGMSVGRMALAPDGSALYYGTGWEDSWYSCESSRGQIWKLDLEFGVDIAVAPGFGPAVSPDGRWMAALLSQQCLPDPEQPEAWVLTPADTVVLYDLTTGSPIETHSWAVVSPPTSYADPQVPIWVDWREDSQTLVVMNNAGAVYELTLDHRAALDAGAPLAEAIYGYPQALIGDTLYAIVDETPFAVGAFDLVAFDLATGVAGDTMIHTVLTPFAAADTTRTRLIWGTDTEVTTGETAFSLQEYLIGLAW
jgi:hypothetical protein